MPARMQLIQSFLTSCFPGEVIRLERYHRRCQFQALLPFFQSTPKLYLNGCSYADRGAVVVLLRLNRRLLRQVCKSSRSSHKKTFQQGLLLLTDLGHTLLLSKLNQRYRCELLSTGVGTTLAGSHYQFERLQGLCLSLDLAFLLREMQIFIDWFVLQHLKLTLNEQEHAMLQQHFLLLADTALQQPQAGMRRIPFPKLMLQPDGHFAVIDFQDVVTAPRHL